MKYCPDIWKSLYLEKKSDKTIGIAFCCQNSTTEINADDLAEFALTRRKKQIDFQSTLESSQCANCWNTEKYGQPSRRHATIEWFNNNHPTTDMTEELISLDWNSENVCNLSCISCGPKFSSRWRQEITKYKFNNETSANYISNLQDNKFWKSLDLRQLKRLYFNGGEPLLAQDHIEILAHLECLDRLSDLELSYNTNGTIIPGPEVVELWSKVRLLRISLSLDAVGPAFEYIRWPAKWAQILSFIEFINQQTFNTIINITCTIGIHNILEVDQLIKWQQENFLTNNQRDPVEINFQLVGHFSHGGDVLQLPKVSKQLATAILPQLVEIKNYNIWISIEKILLTADGDNPWISYLDELSKNRNIEWHDYLPALSKLSSTCQISGK
jgi:sulfatase maturation enzyme AslB (radical SAM superfamily)